MTAFRFSRKGWLARGLSAAGSVLVALLLCFLLLQATPGDAFSQLELDPNLPAATLQHLRQQFEPQRSTAERFGAWLGAALQGDLGESLTSHQPVLELLRQRAAASFELILLGLGLAWAAGLLAAIVQTWLNEAGYIRGARRLDLLGHGAASALAALPLGVLALGALVSAPVDWLPGVAAPSPWLPALVLALAFLPAIYLHAVHALGQARQRGFVQHSHAAGIAPLRIVLIHVLPNAADVLAPVASLTLSQALVELVILEPLLGWPGLGQLSLQAAQTKDMPVLAGLVLLTSLVVIGANWTSEAAQLWLNPQLRPSRTYIGAEAVTMQPQ